MRRRLAGEILGRIEARGFEIRAGKLLTVDRDLGGTALRRAPGEAVLRRPRRVHHLGADVGARGRGRGRDRDVAQDDRRDEPGRRRRQGRSAATSRCRCPTTSCTAPTRRSRPSARSRSGSPAMSSPDDSSATSRVWTKANTEHTDAASAAAWARSEIVWGMFHVPESELRILGDVAGLDVVELGCGTAYISAWLTKRGARAVGVDPTPAQLATARRLMDETGIRFELVEAPGEAVPLPDAAFDLVHSEHGAVTWADPYRWIPEARRLLRPGGRLVFLHTTHACARLLPAGRARDRAAAAPVLRPRPHRVARGGRGRRVPACSRGLDRSSARHRLRGRAAHRAPGAGGCDDASVLLGTSPREWARKWPAEEIWVARKA